MSTRIKTCFKCLLWQNTLLFLFHDSRVIGMRQVSCRKMYVLRTYESPLKLCSQFGWRNKELFSLVLLMACIKIETTLPRRTSSVREGSGNQGNQGSQGRASVICLHRCVFLWSVQNYGSKAALRSDSFTRLYLAHGPPKQLRRMGTS